MTRPDSVLLAIVMLGFAGAVALRSDASLAARLSSLAALALPLLAIIVPWLSWKLAFYGDIVPNTFYIKLGIHRPGTALRGLAYVAWPFASYWCAPLIAYLAYRTRGRAFSVDRAFHPLVAYTVLWLGYAVWIGGDIMEFRQLICVFPCIILLIVKAWSSCFPERTSMTRLGPILLAASLVHGQFFPAYLRPKGIGTIPVLTTELAERVAIGTQLRNDLGAVDDLTIAVSPAGAIPYCSGLRSIDILGLNDHWVARNGYVRRGCDVCLGHLRLATFRYLNEERVNLVFGHPQEALGPLPSPDPVGVMRKMFYGEEIDYENVLPDATLVWISVEGRTFAALYLRKHPRVEELIASHTWTVQRLSARGTQAGL